MLASVAEVLVADLVVLLAADEVEESGPGSRE